MKKLNAGLLTRFATRFALAALLSLQLVACSDSMTGPRRRMDRDGVENILPAVNDARRRVASGVADVSVRQQLTIALAEIEISLRADDVEGVARGMKKVGSLMTSYSAHAHGDRPEVSAVLLVMSGVERVAMPGALSNVSY
jgi:hypothetical protein